MGVIIRQSIKATVINYMGALIGFLTTMFVLVKFLRPEEIGLTKVIFEIAGLIAGIAQLGTSASIIRFFPYFRDSTKKHNGFFFYIMVVPAIGSLVFVSLFLLLQEPIVGFFQQKSALLVGYYDWIVPLIFFIVFWTVMETYASALLRIVVPKFIREIGVRLMLLVVYLLYAFHYLDLTGLVTGFVLIYGIAMLFMLLYVSRITSVSLKHNFSFIEKPLLLKFLKYTLFLFVGALGGNIIGQLDIFMISSQMGLDYTGIYTIALYMAVVIEMPARSISAISIPLAAFAMKEGDLHQANQLYKKVSLHQLIAGSTLFLFIWINIDNIFAIIPNGDVYRAGKWVVFFLAMSKIVSMTLSFGGTLVAFSKYYYWGLYFTFFLTALTIASNSLLIPLWGITGAAVATLLTCLVGYLAQQWIVMKKVKGNPYSIGIWKQVGVILFLLGGNMLLPHWSGSPYIDGIYRSVIIGLIWLLLTYHFRISDEFCELVKKYVLRKR